MHVAILDDGINESYYGLGSLRYNLEISSSGQIEERSSVLSDSHGTTCAAIIKKYAPAVELSSIKVLGDDDVGTVLKLLLALNWCQTSGVDIVHLSLGTTAFQDFKAISGAVISLLKKDIIIVAAISNDNRFTVPAHMAGVIGVTHTDTLVDDKIFVENSNYENFLIGASGRHFLRNCAGKITITRPSNSYAAPAVTAKVIQTIDRIKTRDLKRIFGNFHKLDKSASTSSIPIYLPFCFTNAKVIGRLPCLGQVFFAFDDMADTLVCTSPRNITGDLLCTGNKIRNFIYAGGVLQPEQKQKIMQAIAGMVCDEQDLCIKESSEREIAVPLVGIQGDRLSVIKIMQLLDAQFREEGFYSIALTNIPLGYLYGFYWIDGEKDLPRKLAYIEDRFKNDILLFGAESLDKYASWFDYIVDADRIIGLPKDRKSDSERGAEQEECKKLYNDILRYFS